MKRVIAGVIYSLHLPNDCGMRLDHVLVQRWVKLLAQAHVVRKGLHRWTRGSLCVHHAHDVITEYSCRDWETIIPNLRPAQEQNVNVMTESVMENTHALQEMMQTAAVTNSF